MYSEGVENENFLRGVQEAGSDGSVTFTTVFPMSGSVDEGFTATLRVPV